MQQHNEFYIGWQAEAPPGVARKVRHFIVALALLVPVFILLVTVFQRGFSNAVFEYGKVTELEGVLRTKPIPFLTIENGRDANRKPVFQNILLVGAGKFGFQPSSTNGLAGAVDGSAAKVTGFLIYHDGKTALEVASIQPQLQTINFKLQTKILGSVRLRGEITDPKCLLGVMQPGEGKPHRDCAARCIAGGIPPLLKVANASGEAEYYLVVGPDGQPLNDLLQNYTADGVELCGRLEQSADWLILYADPGSLQRVSKWLLEPGPMCQ